jgi:hypothetical protein
MSAMSFRLDTRPQRSAASESGNVRRPTISDTTPLRDPSSVSVRCHCALSNGKTAFSTCRDM